MVSEAERRRLLAWTAGAGNPPWWTEVLLMAETWRTPPWEIIETAPVEWVERWRALQYARAAAQEVAAGQARIIDGRVYHKVT